MITINIESFEYIEMIDDRLRERWDYTMSDEEFDAMQRYFDGMEDLPHPHYVADNYCVNSDKGDGSDIVDRHYTTEESFTDFLEDCAFYWGSDLVYEIIRDEYLDSSEKEQKLKELDFDRFGFVLNL